MGALQHVWTHLPGWTRYKRSHGAKVVVSDTFACRCGAFGVKRAGAEQIRSEAEEFRRVALSWQDPKKGCGAPEDR